MIVDSQESAEQHKRLREIDSLLQATQAVTSSLNLQEILPVIAEKAAEAVGAGTSRVYLLNESAGRLEAAAAWGAETHWPHYEFSLGEGTIGWVAQHAEPLLISNTTHDPHFEVKSSLSHLIVNTLTVPMQTRGKVVGVLQVANKDASGSFSAEEQRILMAFANQAAIAVENARLFEELSRNKEELKRKAVQLRRLLAKTVSVQEEERRRIALDLHDGVTQLILGALYETQAAEQSLFSGPEVARQRLASARALLDQSLAEMRQVVFDLRPPSLDELGLVPVLQKYMQGFVEASGPHYCFEVRGAPHRLAVPAEVAIYRIIQEALHNARKHADATIVRLILEFEPEMLRITIEDDGKGFAQNREMTTCSEHLGLAGMKERAGSIGAVVGIDSEVGRGTKIVITIPTERACAGS
ncbi:MAG: GAF domain-containing sensor histidine kinase [Chloroflexi bacterium]|nr:GAF domain-containing sensor histidine kinase [Chloroflexota bacterium]MCL5076124.1 GAF domain-containing sensor histidine kinase [Chloroflexota bacterium]